MLLEEKQLPFSVAHCKDLAATFKQNGIEAAAIWGSMNPDLRKDTLIQFSTGTISILTSVGVLTEEYDEKTINAIIMARPTKSKSLYFQCVGRGLRVSPGK